MPSQATPERQNGLQETKPAMPVRVDGTVLRLSTDELVRLAPRLRPYLTTPAPNWPAVVDAADWLRGELGVEDGDEGQTYHPPIRRTGRRYLPVAIIIQLHGSRALCRTPLARCSPGVAQPLSP